MNIISYFFLFALSLMFLQRIAPVAWASGRWKLEWSVISKTLPGGLAIWKTKAPVVGVTVKDGLVYLMDK